MSDNTSIPQENQHYIGIHWLTVIVRYLPGEFVRGMVSVWLGQSFTQVGGARFFAERWESNDTNTTVLSGHRGDGGDMVAVNFTGAACEGLQPWDFATLVDALEVNGGKVNISRVDYAVDGLPFSVDEFARAVELGGIKHTASKISYMWTKRKEEEREIKENTFYIGSRSSKRMIRVYDRRLDGDGKQVVRVEIQLRDEHAQQFFDHLRDNITQGDTKSGLLPFVAVFTDMLKISWQGLLKWVRGLVESPAFTWARIPAAIKSIDRKQAWLLKSVSKTLASVAAVYPGTPIYLVGAGYAKMTESDKQFIQDARSYRRPPFSNTVAN